MTATGTSAALVLSLGLDMGVWPTWGAELLADCAARATAL